MPGGGLEFSCEKPKEHVEDLEHVMKTLQSLETTDEKLSVLCKKYAELLEEHRTMQTSLKQTQRTLSVLAREKDQLQNDHSKAVLAKSKLEGLCRELQRHNRLVKDESAARAKEDDERRKEVAAKFQTTINDIQQQMNEHYQKNSTLREENMELTKKLKGLIEQYELREQHIEKVLQHKDLETQLLEAKLSQASVQLQEEKERNIHEKQQLIQEALETQKHVVLLSENEKQLKAQVAMYQDKYDEFQQTLTKSNDVFQNFKNEMDKMAKKIKKLEKETAMYRQRWESSNKALLTMAEEKTRNEKEVTVLQSKVSKLESLCRALQEERRKLTDRSVPDMTADVTMFTRDSAAATAVTDKPSDDSSDAASGPLNAAADSSSAAENTSTAAEQQPAVSTSAQQDGPPTSISDADNQISPVAPPGDGCVDPVVQQDTSPSPAETGTSHESSSSVENTSEPISSIENSPLTHVSNDAETNSDSVASSSPADDGDFAQPVAAAVEQ